jgi:hypothetical protein
MTFQPNAGFLAGCTVALALIHGTPAIAQPSGKVPTRFGIVEVKPSINMQGLKVLFNGRQLNSVPQTSGSLTPRFQFQMDDRDIILYEGEGGADCPFMTEVLLVTTRSANFIQSSLLSCGGYHSVAWGEDDSLNITIRGFALVTSSVEEQDRAWKRLTTLRLKDGKISKVR